ncbi:MAG: AEC family transporter [Clostridiales Family XIII bacterium]|jgi:predicted permease|nr:AEC family transporter [Clostridiales Family XIII bacterium]
MSSFATAFNAVTPMFLLISLGVAARRAGLVTEEAASQLNRVVFTVFLPALLFNNAYSASFAESASLRLALFTLAAVVAVWLLACLCVCLAIKSRPMRGTMIQGIFRSNFILFGIPVATNLYGEENIGATSFMVAVLVPIFNVLAVVTLEVFRGNKVKPLGILAGIAKNPLILGLCAGLLAFFSGLRLPAFIGGALESVAGAATPLALIVMGAALTFKGGAGTAPLAAAVFGKLAAVPLLVLPVAVRMGFRGVELATAAISFASPTAVASYAMAKHMGGDDVLAARIVVASTFCSCLTMFLWVYALKELGLI